MEINGIVKQLKVPEGKILVFGGVYGNYPALAALRKTAEALNIPPSNIFCTGDIAGYCASPDKCIQTLMEWGIQAIAGNVEKQLTAGADNCGCEFSEGGRCELLSKSWFPFTKKNISEASKKWIAALPDFISFNYRGRQCFVLHGSCFHNADFIFKSTPWQEKERNFEAAGAQIILAGHCGLPFIDKSYYYTWLNAGVIGMPANDGETSVWYLLMDLDDAQQLQPQFCRLDYDFESAAALMEANGLPAEYAKTLRTGIWDNCEILPEEETMNQGMKINLA